MLPNPWPILGAILGWAAVLFVSLLILEIVRRGLHKGWRVRCSRGVDPAAGQLWVDLWDDSNTRRIVQVKDDMVVVETRGPGYVSSIGYTRAEWRSAVVGRPLYLMEGTGE